MNLSELFAIPTQRTPQKVALAFADGAQARNYSYAELHDEAARLAAGLQAWGLRKGDRVAFFAGNSPAFVIAWLAVIRLGAIMVPINLRYRRLELGHILSDCAPRLLLSERALLPLLDELGDARSSLEAVLLVEELAAWQADAAALRPEPVAGDDIAFIMYTSGTTGRSKGACMSHNAILATVTALLAAWGWQQEDRLLLVLPLFHTHGLVVGLHCALAAGATVLLRPQFEAEQTVNELFAGVATCFFAVPTIYVRLVDELRRRAPADPASADRAALAAMRLFCSGSAPLAADTFNAFRELTGHAILERYGMTETGMNLSNLYAGARVAGSVGVPLPGVAMRIVRVEEGGGAPQDVAPGDEGELLVRGANLFSGYWNAPEKTSESFSRDAAGARWFHTGDLARQDPATGYVTLLGRRHELIISGGFNIYPREIEELLVTFAGVREAAVVGVKHPEWGEVPAAWLVCDGALDEEALVRWCRTQMASFKVPRTIHVVDALPRNAMGKVMKNSLNSRG